jgi:hypothetical protein
MAVDGPDARRRDQNETADRKQRQRLGLDYASYRDLSEFVNHPEVGGFTAIPTGPRAGEAPPNTFLVGTKAEEKVVGTPTRAEDIMTYAEEREPVLTRRGRFLGGWQDSGRTFLDSPRGYPTTPRGESSARRATLREDQEAYGALDAEGQYAGSMYNPYHERAKSGDIVASDSTEQRKIWAAMPERTGTTSVDPKRGRRVKPGEGGSFS